MRGVVRVWVRSTLYLYTLGTLRLRQGELKKLVMNLRQYLTLHCCHNLYGRTFTPISLRQDYHNIDAIYTVSAFSITQWIITLAVNTRLVRCLISSWVFGWNPVYKMANKSGILLSTLPPSRYCTSVHPPEKLPWTISAQ